jgi:hypothetical protein
MKRQMKLLPNGERLIGESPKERPLVMLGSYGIRPQRPVIASDDAYRVDHIEVRDNGLVVYGN